MSTVVVSDQRWLTTLAVTVRSDGRSPRVMRTWAGDRLREEADRLELAASRFRPDSEISRVNAAPGRWTDVSPLLRTLLGLGLVAAELTDGLCHPALGRQVDAAGYRQWAAANRCTAAGDSPGATRRHGSRPAVTGRAGEATGEAGTAQPGTAGPGATEPSRTAEADGVPPGVVDWRAIELVGDRVRIPPGAELDLGAIAKAWLADRLAEALAEDLAADVVANMGGDLRAISSGTPWTVGVDHGGMDQGRVAAREDLLVTDCALATSSRGRRRWTCGGRDAHHLIDPRTGRPAKSPWLAVSVLAADAVQANAAASAALVLGAPAPTWLAGTGLDGLFTAADGPILRVGSWPTTWRISVSGIGGGPCL